MPGDAIFLTISILLIIAYTWYMMSTMMKRSKLLRELTKMIKDAENAAPKDESPPPEE